MFCLACLIKTLSKLFDTLMLLLMNEVFEINFEKNLKITKNYETLPSMQRIK